MTIYRGIDLNWTDGRLFSFIAVGLLDTLIILLQAGTSILSWNMLNNLFKKTP